MAECHLSKIVKQWMLCYLYIFILIEIVLEKCQTHHLSSINKLPQRRKRLPLWSVYNKVPNISFTGMKPLPFPMCKFKHIFPKKGKFFKEGLTKYKT